MGLALEGQCNSCGDCCKYPVVAENMATAKVGDEYWCRFLRKKLDGTFACTIIEKMNLLDGNVVIGAEKLDISVVDTSVKTDLEITDSELGFFCRNVGFPNSPSGIRTILAGLVPNCSFKIVDE